MTALVRRDQAWRMTWNARARAIPVTGRCLFETNIGVKVDVSG